MPFEYPEEISEQQALVKRELKKLAKMRTDYLKSTGQMPPSAAKTKSPASNGKRAAPSPNSGRTEETSS